MSTSHSRQRILLKITGMAFVDQTTGLPSDQLIRSLARQCAALSSSHQFGIVIGGGNFFRGSQQGRQLNISPAAGHQVGMLATAMNGLLLQDLFAQEHVPTQLFSALACAAIGQPVTHGALETAYAHNEIPVCVAGMGVPYFSTDTAAVVRALQCNASMVWKATNVDGIYNCNPAEHADAQLIPYITYNEALCSRIGILDNTAILLAEQHQVSVRVFNITTPDALINAAHNPSIGSLMSH